jgi:CheY-like chemotaxis protein
MDTRLSPSIRSNPVLRHLPIIAVSAHINQSDGEVALQAGFDAYLTKPVDLDEMLVMIRRYLPQDGTDRKA